jgi:hypothetical protein
VKRYPKTVVLNKSNHVFCPQVGLSRLSQVFFLMGSHLKLVTWQWLGLGSWLTCLVLGWEELSNWVFSLRVLSVWSQHRVTLEKQDSCGSPWPPEWCIRRPVVAVYRLPGMFHKSTSLLHSVCRGFTKCPHEVCVCVCVCVGIGPPPW